MVAKDTSTARRLAHSLKGAAANLGLSTLAEVAARAEFAIESEQDIPRHSKPSPILWTPHSPPFAGLYQRTVPDELHRRRPPILRRDATPAPD